MFKYYLSIGVLTVFVIVLIVYGIIQSGGPVSAKSIKLDEERINNFTSISSQINEYFYDNDTLPETLQILSQSKSTGTRLKFTDPESKKPYEYKKLSPYDYSLCAIFSTDSTEVSRKYESYDYYDSYSYADEKKHPKGYACINYKIDDYYINDAYDDANYTPVNNSSDNTKRKSDITQILNAIGAYQADNGGLLPSQISSKSAEISDIGVDLCSTLVPDYIASLPMDPSYGEGSIDDCTEIYDTGYFIVKDNVDRVTVSAPFADKSEKITITR